MSRSLAAEELDAEVARNRDPDHDVAPLFVNRWSPRAMSGASLAEADLLPLFEAARWAPSAFNNQHWRFVYATREDEECVPRAAERDQLDVGGRRRRAGRRLLEADLRAQRRGGHDPVVRRGRGLAVHPMAGFEWGRIQEALGVPAAEFDAEAMVAVGERAAPETLPADLREREVPSGRKPLVEIVSNGRFE